MSDRLRRLTLLLATTFAVALTGACTDGDDEPAPAPEPLAWQWSEVRLPAPGGPAVSTERIVVRSVVNCGTHWYAAGGLATPTDDTRPALWRSADGVAWESLPVRPMGFWGRQHILYSVACHEDVVSVLGAKRGGAHANPRTSHWRMVAGGPLTEVISSFELYGGPDAVNVARVVAGPRGFMIAGNRMTGAAAWTSTDGADFVLHSGSPPLAGGDDLYTAAADATADAAGWTLVGGASQRGRTDRDPVAWTSADGTAWQRADLAGDDAYEELQRVVRVGDDLLATGVRGSVFGSWRGHGGQWEATSGFGSVQAPGAASGPTMAGGIASMATTGRVALVAAGDGRTYTVWRSADSGNSWRQVGLPADHPVGAERSLAVAGAGDRWLLAGDDGKRGRIWYTDVRE